MHDFDETGYLGQGIRQFQNSTLAKFDPFFAQCRDVCRFARITILKLKFDNTDLQKVLSCCLFAKILNGVETTYILSTYGLTHEGRVILRSVLEGFFFLRATLADKPFARKYVLDDELKRLKLMEAAKKYDRPPFLEIRRYATDEVIRTQREKIKQHKIQKLNLWEIAHGLGLQHLYDSLYRLLSTDIHTGARSLEQYMRTGAAGDVESFDSGPQTDDVEQNLSMGIDILTRSLECLDNLFVLSIADQLQSMMKRLEKIQSSQSEIHHS
jgi:hypothetical protein